MNSLASLPWPTLLVAIPALGGLLASRVAPTSRRGVALGFAVVSLVLAGLLVLAFVLAPEQPVIEDVGPSLFAHGPRWHLGLDDLAAPFVALSALVVVLVLVAAPRHELEGAMIPAILITHAATIGVYESLDLACLAVFWIASLGPGAVVVRAAIRASKRTPRTAVERLLDGTSDARALRTYLVFLVLGAIPILLAVGLVASDRASSGAALPFDLSDPTIVVSVGGQGLAFLLLVSALLVRKAVFPFQSWLPVLSEHGPIAITILLTATHLGAFLASRVVMPLLPDASAQYLPWVADLALGSALYGALVGIAQRDLRRLLGFVLTSQMGLVLVGMAEANRESLHGALLQMLALGLSSTGLLLIVAQLEVRTGTTDLRQLRGLGQRVPRMAGAFLVLALTAIGFPGTLMFVSEDLLLHGLLGSHPIEATLLLIVTVLNGITLVRAFFAVFLGQPLRGRHSIGETVPDLLPRETLVAAALIAITLATGFSPTPLLHVREGVVTTLSRGEHGLSEHAH